MNLTILASIVGLMLLCFQQTSYSVNPSQCKLKHRVVTSEQRQKALEMEFVQIPAGSFVMGSPADLANPHRDEQPQHQVTLSKSFEMGKYEVTQAQWQAVMGSDASTLPQSSNYNSLPGMAERLSHPEQPVNVSWEDAQAFIQRLNEREGANIYRLPTEAEWEYVARAGTTTAYSFGEEASDLEKYAWYGENLSTGSSHEVGQKAPNPWGLHDMHGNVWEWVQDWYAPDYYSRSPAQDPQGPETGSGHVVRGGSWLANSDGWHSAFRKVYAPNYRAIGIGFRVVKQT